MSSKAGGGSRASDEDSRTAVKVGMCLPPIEIPLAVIRDEIANSTFTQLSASAPRSNSEIQASTLSLSVSAVLPARYQRAPPW